MGSWGAGLGGPRGGIRMELRLGVLGFGFSGQDWVGGGAHLEDKDEARGWGSLRGG